MTARRLSLAVVLLSSALPAAAQDVPGAIRFGAACAPVGIVGRDNAPRIGTSERLMFAAGSAVTINQGTRDGVSSGQRYYVRRRMSFPGAPEAEHTLGWLTIVEAKEEAAIARIDHTCGAIFPGDHLETFADVVLPSGVDRTEAAGSLDFSRQAHVLYGADGRSMLGDRDFVLVTGGQQDGVVAGARFGIYHRGKSLDNSVPTIAEAIVVTVFPGKSLVRITSGREEVTAGDVLVPRIGVAVRVAADVAPAPAVEVGEGSAPVTVGGDEDDAGQGIAFDEVHFDFDRQVLRADAKKMLDDAIKRLTDDPSMRVYIEGYTCDIGTPEYNLALGERRAKSVRDYLVAHGVDEKRLTTVSFGEEHAKYDNSKLATRKLNRRAVLVVNMHTEVATTASR